MDTTPRIIGLCGRMGSGKDETARILGKIGYERTAFADALRREVEHAIRTRECLVGPEHWNLVVEYSGRPEAVWAKPTEPKMRRLLQIWGTEYRRREGPLYWVKKTMPYIFDHPDTLFAISDVRFPNEADAVRLAGGVIWKIERPSASAIKPSHVSESLVDQIEPDALILNDGTIADLEATVLQVLPQAIAA